MIDFATLQGLTIPEGVVTKIESSGVVLWEMQNGRIVLEVEKYTSDTYAGETTYTGESFILLDIYPKTNGTVSVTYGGLTKTVTDTSGGEKPNAIPVFFGTFNGVSDNVETPASGTLTIDGDYYAVGVGKYKKKSDKISVELSCDCVTAIKSLGTSEELVDEAFYLCSKLKSVTFADGLKTIGAYAFQATTLTSITLPKTLRSIGNSAFWSVSYDGVSLTAEITSVVIPSGVTNMGYYNFAGNVIQDGSTIDVACYLETLIMLPTTPPVLAANSDGVTLGNPTYFDTKIIVPKGCSAAYKAAEGWKEYADRIVEEA